MTWFRCGGSGIPAALKNRMNAVFNKKFGTSGQNYPPKQWPDDVNLLGPLPEATVSGSVAHLEDGADAVPIKSWEVEIAPTLTGKSAIECTQTGKNLVDASTIENGYQININSGLPTAWNGRCATTSPIMIHGGNITVSFSSTDSLVRMMYSFFKNGTFVERVANIESGTTINAHDYDTMYIGFANVNGVAITKDVLSNIQIEVGSTATTYEPYTAPTVSTVNLGRTIYGGKADIVNGVGTDENGNDFTFTPITPTPETALGVNNFWADEGDTTVVYRRDIDLALQAVSNSRSLMMTRPTIEPANGDQGSEESTENNIETEGDENAR